ncbi:MAG: FtsW/RodA/SpoVE family cell cycle protein [Clostridia bacterium]|nr:FtsW/RodA/SpoVE family cell cycle protein [Clostridia bacterium]
MIELLDKIVAHHYMQYLMLGLRIITPMIVLFVVWRCYTSFKKGLRRYDPVIMLHELTTGQKFPILYWENSIGRSRTCDITIPDPSVSRDHAVLLRREEGWFICDSGSKAGTYLNGEKVEGRELVALGDVIRMGRTELEFDRSDIPAKVRRRMFTGFMKQAASPSALLFLVTLIQSSMCLQLMLGTGEINFEPLTSYVGIVLISWLFYFFSTRIFKRTNFELETVGILLTSIGIMLQTGEGEGGVMTQILAFVIGLVIFSGLLMFLSDADRADKYHYILAGGALLLFAVNLVIGTEVYGSKNWIMLGPVSFQPSELIKIVFIIVGAGTLDRLQTKKNITEFIIFGGACLGCLFLMRDFGTACIFFAGFLVIAFMRSGSVRTIALILAVAVLGVFMIINFKPYVADRFAGWMHVWDHINDSYGYQQTRALTYIASGGLFGMGLGRGYLHFVAAADCDLVFAMLSEEQGLFMGLTVVFALALLIMYTRADVARSRSTFYSICSSAAAGILVFQMCLNIFGTTDVLPLTGVTLPFISAGGSSLMSVWGMLALIKASDERTYAAKRANHKEKKMLKQEELQELRDEAIRRSEERMNRPGVFSKRNSRDVWSGNDYIDDFEQERTINKSYYNPKDYGKESNEEERTIIIEKRYSDDENYGRTRRDPGRRYSDEIPDFLQNDIEDVRSDSRDISSGRRRRR